MRINISITDEVKEILDKRRKSLPVSTFIALLIEGGVLDFGTLEKHPEPKIEYNDDPYVVDPGHAARKAAIQAKKIESTFEPMPHKPEEIDLEKLSEEQKRASLKRSHPTASEKQIDYFMTLALDQDGNLIYED